MTNLPGSSLSSEVALRRAGAHVDELEAPSTSSSGLLDVRARPVVSPGSSSEVTFVYVGDLERPSTSSSGLNAASGTTPQLQSCIQGTSTRSPRVSRGPTLEQRERLATTYFQKNFLEVVYGVACSVCERLRFKRDVRPATAGFQHPLERMGLSVENPEACHTCYNSLKRGNIPRLAASNGFTYPPDPGNLPALNSITRRLISPRIPFMQVRNLRYDTGRNSIVGQVINVPVDVQAMVSTLPRTLSED